MVDLRSNVSRMSLATWEEADKVALEKKRKEQDPIAMAHKKLAKCEAELEALILQSDAIEQRGLRAHKAVQDARAELEALLPPEPVEPPADGTGVDSEPPAGDLDTDKEPGETDTPDGDTDPGEGDQGHTDEPVSTEPTPATVQPKPASRRASTTAK